MSLVLVDVEIHHVEEPQELRGRPAGGPQRRPAAQQLLAGLQVAPAALRGRVEEPEAGLRLQSEKQMNRPCDIKN